MNMILCLILAQKNPDINKSLDVAWRLGSHIEKSGGFYFLAICEDPWFIFVVNAGQCQTALNDPTSLFAM